MTGGTAMTWSAHVRDLDWLKARVTVVGEYGVSESTVSDIRYGRRRALQGAS